MHVPIEGISHDSAEPDSPETWLLSDKRELEEGDEQHGAGQVAHSSESLSLTELLLIFTVQPLPSTRCFSV